MRTLSLLLLLSFASPAVWADQPTLRIAVSENWGMPLMDYHANRSHAGILHDVHTRIAEHLNYRVHQPPLARARLLRMLENGELDLFCYINAKWIKPEQTRHYLWSVPFLVQEDVLVSRPEDLQREYQLGEVVGTVSEYVYPDLTPLFQQGRLVRNDGRSQLLVLKKLQAGRYHFAVSNQLTLDWFNQQHAPQQRLHRRALLSSDDTACLVRNQSDLPTQAILEIIREMRDSGEITQILGRYR